jgi:Protein of unknown function (DUF2971)
MSEPSVLYHYCSTPAFHAIIESRSLRLSSLSLSNDSMEGKLVARTIARLAERDSLKISDQQRLLEMVATLERYFDGLGFCLSEERDLLSQWRGYAANATGVAIGFSKYYLEQLSKNIRDSSKTGFSVWQVQYDPAIHEAEVEPTYQEARNFINQGAFSFAGKRGLLDSRSDEQVEEDEKKTESQLASLSLTLMMRLFPKLYLLKSPAFKEEREWRLLSNFIRSGRDQCSYRASEGRVIPFRKFDLISLPDQPIAEVVLGPKHLTPIHLVKDFLKHSGFDGAKVLRSEATYR